MNPARILIAAASSGAGKSTVSLGLMAALARRGMRVRPFKVGPDYIDPSLHERAAGRPSYNLDAWLAPESVLRGLFFRHAGGSGRDIAVIEGVMGLFDGLDASAYASTAHVASLLAAPTLLVVNAQGMSLSLAALVSGFAAFRPKPSRQAQACCPDLAGLRLAGVVLNRVSGPRHAELLARIIHEQCSLPCLGALPSMAAPVFASRHLGLVPAQELPNLDRQLQSLADAVEEYVDLAALLTLAQSAPAAEDAQASPEACPGVPPAGPHGSLSAPRPEAPPAPLADIQSKAQPASATEGHASASRPATPPAPLTGSLSAPLAGPPPNYAGLRLGLARDRAFSFYYEDNLDFLREAGAELVCFSPLKDAALPENLHGLYLGGGFPEVFAAELEANAPFRQALARALEAGLPAYAECGGMLYLCQSLAAAPAKGPASDPPKAAATEAATGLAPGPAATGPTSQVAAGPVTGAVAGPAAGAADPPPGPARSMAGFFPVRAQMATRLQPFGYVTVRLLRDCLLGPAGTEFTAHEFHYSRLAENDQSAAGPPLFQISKIDGRAWSGGLARANTLAAYPHILFRGCPQVALSFLDRCRDFRDRHKRGAA